MVSDDRTPIISNDDATTKCSKKPSTIIIICIVLLILIIGIVLIAVYAGRSSGKATSDDTMTLMVSLDGFRAEYLSRGLTPNLQKIASEGVRADFMRPVFPTMTFVNHYTMATGLYPEKTGIVANKFYDEEYGSFGGGNLVEGKWFGGEPVSEILFPGKRKNISKKK